MARRLLLVLSALVLLVSPGCGGSGEDTAGASSGDRPVTPARLQIVAPAPGEVTGTQVPVELTLTGAREVTRTDGPITPDEGHVHIAVDGRVVAMSYVASHTLSGLSPGPHSVQVEFVAVDHQRFANRVVAAVLFTVGE